MSAPTHRFDTVYGDPLRDIKQVADAEDDPRGCQGISSIHSVSQIAHAAGGDDVVENLIGAQLMCRWLLSSYYFEPFFCTLVILDLIMVAVAIDVDVDSTDSYRMIVHSMNFFFFLAFAAELVIRIIAAPYSVCKDRLILFDFFIVFISLVEIVAAMQHMTAKPVLDNLSIVMNLRIIRVVRVCRIATYVKELVLIKVLTQAISSSLHPLCMVLVCSMIIAVFFATMMTALAPAAAMNGDEIEDAVLRYYASVWRSFATLLEGMSGSSDWGSNAAFVLFQGVRQGKTTSAAMLLTMLLSSVVLRLGLNGFVTAVFLEQLFNASDEEDDSVARQDLVQGELFKELDRVFMDAGHGKGALTLAQIRSGLQNNAELKRALHLNAKEVEQLFEKADQDKDGLINADEFVSAVLRHRAMSNSADMLSMEYQQGKALQRISELEHIIRDAIDDVQSRLTHLFALLPELEKEIAAARKDLVEVQDLEKAVQEMERARKALLRDEQSASSDCDEEAEEVDGVPDIENIRSSLSLNHKLAKVEALAAEVLSPSPGSETGLSSEEERAHHLRHVGVVADSIVQSVQLALQQELAAVRVMAAEQRRATTAEHRRVMAAEQRPMSAEPAAT